MEDFENQFSYIASLLGDKARSLMLWNLLDGRAYTATELALCADISPQSASNHLSKLIKGNILEVVRQGRHRYYRFANDQVAQTIESMAGLLPTGKTRATPAPPAGITYARTCYDHAAGKLGVALTDALLAKNIIEANEKQYLITPQTGENWFGALGIDIAQLRTKKRAFAYQCLDWSERRHHLAGALGAALLQAMLNKQWIRKKENTREVVVTVLGKTALKDSLNLEI